MIGDSLQIGLKEWHAVARAVEAGRQIVLLRKGGIHETEGRFELEHRAFVMFPTWLHQKNDWIKSSDQPFVESRETEPEQIELRVAATVQEIIRIQSRAQMDAADAFHIYLPPLIDMRFNYKPHNPLYLMVIRAYALPEPVTIDNTPAYAGCRSWVPLDQAIATTAAKPVLSDADFTHRAAALKSALGI